MDLTNLPHGGTHDFDFLAGRWRVRNRRLTTRLRGTDDWAEFDATHHCERWLNGGANVDQIDFTSLGWSGMTVRTFDVAQRRWSIYWINSRDGVLTPPVHGGFDGDRGLFYGEDTDDGRPVQVRFVWTRLGPDAAHWEQAFSLDGREWEVNWTMALARIAG
jgi:hypothetical protein